MTDFRKAIEAGLKNAEAAESANNEIAAILLDLKTDIEATSNGKVTLVTSTSPWQGIVKSANPSNNELPRSIELQSNVDASRKVEVATYQSAPDGYPVRLTAFGKSLSAGDAEGLRHAFESVFERSEVGRQMLELMRHTRPAGLLGE